MADVTTRYSFPFHETTDAPDGPALGEDLAEAVETALGSVDDRVTVVEGNIADLGVTWLAQQRFTASGTFTKATYPLGTKVHVRCVGGGGGGGGCQINAAGNNSAGGAGGGGAYAESWLDTSALATSVTVTVGAGGTAGGTAGSGTAGNGGDSSFGAHVVAGGGVGGGNGGTGTTWFFVTGGAGGTASAGDVQMDGSAGTHGIRNGTSYISGQQAGGTGGAAAGFGGGGGASGVNAVGSIGRDYGGGGGGSSSAASTAARNGIAGAPGLVIVDIYG